MSDKRISYHIIMTSGRTGSNYLSNLLNLHPQIVNYGEVLAKDIVPFKLFELYKKCARCPWTVEEYLEAFHKSNLFFYIAQLYSAGSHLIARKPINFKRRGNIKSIGTKDFFLNIRVNQVEKFFISRPDIAIIHLYRENQLMRYLSGVFLVKTKVATTEKNISIAKVVIDIPKMMKALAAIDREKAEEHRILNELKNHRIFSIKYEDYFSSEESISDHNRRLFEFLNVEPISTTSQYKKILPHQISDMVENYEEFRASLINTHYEQYL